MHNSLSLARYSCAAQACDPKTLSLACEQAGSLLPSTTLLPKKTLCYLFYIKVMQTCPSPGHLSGLWWRRGAAHCAIKDVFGHPAAWADLLHFVGLYINISCLRQPPNASATAFIGTVRVTCSAWMGLTSIWQISAPLGSVVETERVTTSIAWLQSRIWSL